MVEFFQVWPGLSSSQRAYLLMVGAASWVFFTDIFRGDVMAIGGTALLGAFFAVLYRSARAQARVAIRSGTDTGVVLTLRRSVIKAPSDARLFQFGLPVAIATSAYMVWTASGHWLSLLVTCVLGVFYVAVLRAIRMAHLNPISGTR